MMILSPGVLPDVVIMHHMVTIRGGREVCYDWARGGAAGTNASQPFGPVSAGITMKMIKQHQQDKSFSGVTFMFRSGPFGAHIGHSQNRSLNC